jgi:hypothetical protein
MHLLLPLVWEHSADALYGRAEMDTDNLIQLNSTGMLPLFLVTNFRVDCGELSGSW